MFLRNVGNGLFSDLSYSTRMESSTARPSYFLKSHLSLFCQHSELIYFCNVRSVYYCVYMISSWELVVGIKERVGSAILLQAEELWPTKPRECCGLLLNGLRKKRDVANVYCFLLSTVCMLRLD
jgi:hypothetical protein